MSGLKSLNQSTLAKILNAYSSLGELTRLESDLVFYPCKDWKNPVMSPIFLNQSDDWPAATQGIEKYFQNTPKLSPYDSDAYFCLLTEGKHELAPSLINSPLKEGYFGEARRLFESVSLKRATLLHHLNELIKKITRVMRAR